MPSIILASSSPARKMLMQRLGLAFETVVPDIDETPQSHESAEDLVQRLAYEKAKKVAETHTDAFIIV